MLMKLLLPVAIAIAVILFYRSLDARRQREEEKVRGGGAKASGTVEDMRACRVCGTFRPETLDSSCGRTDCPFESRR